MISRFISTSSLQEKHPWVDCGDGLWTLNFIGGISVGDTTLGTTMGNLGYEEVRFPNPVRIGDTLRDETHILSKRDSKKHPKAGIVMFKHFGFNQKDEVVVTAVRAGMILKRPKDPSGILEKDQSDVRN